MKRQCALRSFDALREIDFEHLYEQSKQEVLREYAFKCELDHADSVEKLKTLVFENPAGPDRWTSRELLEISNRFRLHSAADYEVRLYEETRNSEFRAIPRAQEFYLLALNRVGRPSETIAECRKILSKDGGNGLVWGIFGDAYSIKMLSAEKFATMLQCAVADIGCFDAGTRDEFFRHFPGLRFKAVTLEQVSFLRRHFLRMALQTYRKGFIRTGDAFPGLCWMKRSVDRLSDILMERASILQMRGSGAVNAEQGRIPHHSEAELESLERVLTGLPALLDIALNVRGGDESLDFWTHAGKLEVACIQGQSMEEIRPVLERAFACLDAEFKLQILIKELGRVCDQFNRILNSVLTLGGETAETEHRVRLMENVVSELSRGLARFVAGGSTRGSATHESSRESEFEEASSARDVFLRRTVNFHALTGNLVPQYIEGGLGRVGARVPDLTVNRHVWDDLRSIIAEKVLQTRTPCERTTPRWVIDVIRRLVGDWLGLAKLQDLHSPEHRDFDSRSDGLILLSGIDPVMRKGSRTTTDLTATLLLGTGDCRETMYLNGALFATYQQMQVYEKMADALDRMDCGDMDGFRRIASEEIPAVLRYELRGGHVSVYCQSIAMKEKYHAVRISREDPTAVERTYGMEELRAGQPLSRYELENAKLLVSYSDGTTVLVEPRDPVTGRWKPIEHIPAPGGAGIPLIAETGAGGGDIADIQLLNLVEEHSMCFMYDRESGEIELCDGFYNELLFDSPYQFGSGRIDISDISGHHGMIRAGKRALIGVDGRMRDRQVFIEFLPYSRTDCKPSLGEGDFPGVFQLMGRLFDGRLSEERQRLEDGTSAIPAVMGKLVAWLRRQIKASDKTSTLDQRFARVMIELARDRPELVALHDAKRSRPLIEEGKDSNSVYLVLSGLFMIYRDGKQVVLDNEPVTVGPGAILGEISAIRGGCPTATATGDGVVLRIAKTEFLRQLEINQAFRESVEELVRDRLETLGRVGRNEDALDSNVVSRSTWNEFNHQPV
jgi:CRP-like cAMP-binding protein